MRFMTLNYSQKAYLALSLQAALTAFSGVLLGWSAFDTAVVVFGTNLLIVLVGNFLADLWKYRLLATSKAALARAMTEAASLDTTQPEASPRRP